MYFEKDLERELKIDFADPQWRSRLGQTMWDLNQLALGNRYKDKQEKLRYVYRDIYMFFSHVQSYKALRCWLYQCWQGEIPEKSRLYQ